MIHIQKAKLGDFPYIANGPQMYHIKNIQSFYLKARYYKSRETNKNKTLHGTMTLRG